MTTPKILEVYDDGTMKVYFDFGANQTRTRWTEICTQEQIDFNIARFTQDALNKKGAKRFWTFAELAERYKDHVKKQKDYGTKRTTIDNMLVPRWGKMYLNDDQWVYEIERYRIELLGENAEDEHEDNKAKVLLHLAPKPQKKKLPIKSPKEKEEEKKKKKDLKMSTVNRRTALLKHMFTKARHWKMITVEQLTDIKEIKIPQEANDRLRVLTYEESDRLIENCAFDKRAPILRPVVIVALNTGMRLGEILKLKWEQVNFKAEEIMLYSKGTKNKKIRAVPLNHKARKAIKDIPQRIDSPYIFCNKDGNRFKRVNNSFKSALTRSKIYDFRFHDLRHTFATRYMEKGGDLRDLKEILGHSTLMMTMRYAHTIKGKKLQIAQEL